MTGHNCATLVVARSELVEDERVRDLLEGYRVRRDLKRKNYDVIKGTSACYAIVGFEAPQVRTISQQVRWASLSPVEDYRK